MRTPPAIGDLHPDLQSAVWEVAERHEAVYPERSLCLIWAHRTPEEQHEAWRSGRSGLDGYVRYSLHNYCPAFAADLWVYTSGCECAKLHINRPPRSEGHELQLLQRGSFANFYRPLGMIAERCGLEWGGRWRRLRDGPHVQLPKQRRVLLVQEALQAAGFQPGPLDGIDGRRTALAVAAASGVADINGIPTKRQRQLMPLTPPLWAWLWHRAAQ